MILEISINLLPQEEKNEKVINRKLFEQLENKNITFTRENTTFVFVKKSIDARRKQVKLFMRYKAYIDELPGQENKIPEWKTVDDKCKKVIVAGSGPAGLFGAFTLLEKGIKPVIIERGQTTHERKRDIAKISTAGIVDGNSNYCFGEGGAGTFSDGKLYTRSNKRGSINSVLALFHYFGADEKILTDAHPHIGTDKLPVIIENMRNKILELGGEIHFNTRLESFITENSTIVKGVHTVNTITGEEKDFYGDALLLATGHSAFDIYESLAKTNPESLEAKTFAVGVRVEHPRELIDKIQFHGKNENLGAAEYRLVTQVDGRGVYSFCMCPGGFVVPSATEKDEIVVNGMSSARRNSRWSNAAIVVETKPEDIPQEFVEKAKAINCPQMAGLYWRRWLEQETFKHGNNQQAPAQLLTDFLKGKESQTLPQSSYTAGLTSSRLDLWLPEQIANRLKKAFYDFDSRMKGYICDQALMIASETRTSTPVRILRDKESCQSTALKKLYPAGEGAGYAGGIVSSAMDGINSCLKIAQALLEK